jgi:Xaa-Pro dipeptidase
LTSVIAIEDRPVTDVADIAPLTAFDTVSRTLGGGRALHMNTHSRLGFTLDEYQRRYELVLSTMAEQGLDALCIRTPENITYMSGYETPGYYRYHCLVMGKGFEPVIVLRRFEGLNIPEYSWVTKLVPVDDWEDGPVVTANLLNQLGLNGKRIGVEKRGWFYTVDEHETLSAALPDSEFVDAIQILWDARMIKSDEEITMIGRSAAIVDKAMQAGWDASALGVSDDVINAEVNRVIFENGGEYMGLPPFVLSGERTCLPHQTARSEIVGDPDLVYFEISSCKWRYTAALMRTIFIGEPSDQQRRCAEALIGAVEAAMETIRPGAASEDVDRAARSVVEKAGFGEYWRHRLGYSIGVNYPPDWGEGEVISLCKGETRALQKNMTFHMVPLCLIYREWGIGFSESIRVTDNGCERFSKLSREVIVKR